MGGQGPDPENRISDGKLGLHGPVQTIQGY
jgi:hypothetical protein